tara:strand:- start:166 stop:426 length:261 start_codon:yes stop_codon:yes gene_type:complete
MSSKDFIYDLLDKLEEEKTEYVVLSLDKNKKETRGDMFFNFTNEESFEIAACMLENLLKKFYEAGFDRLAELDGLDVDIEGPNEDE